MPPCTFLPAGWARWPMRTVTIWFPPPGFWLVACLLVGLAARAWHYSSCHSYWYDEAYLLLNIFRYPCLSLLGALDHQVVIPPAFLWILRGIYLGLGSHEWAMRLPALLAGLAALGLMFPLARVLVGRPSWIWAVCLCALSYHALTHGCEVRPYTVDLLLSEAILLSTASALSPTVSPRTRNLGLCALGGLACLGPWVSFPSVFVLGAASLSLLLVAWQDGHGRVGLAWMALNGLLGMSVLALWYLSARHLYYPGMLAHWGHQGWGGFPAWSQPWAVVRWGLATPVRIADYATTSLGIPLVILAVLGLANLRHKTGWPIVLLLTGPIGLAMAAAFLGRYPLADRTVFFAAPCIWLSAARGLEGLRQQWPCRQLVLGLILPAVLLLPGLARMSKRIFIPIPMAEYREAFAFVQEHRQLEDVLWVSHPETYQVYYGSDAPVLGFRAVMDLERLGRARRVWFISNDIPLLDESCCPKRRLREAGSVPVLRRGFLGVEVLRYEPTSAEFSGSPLSSMLTRSRNR